MAWQSGHRPLERGITYGLDGAFPARLQPNLLRAYEWASTRWHAFLHQASRAPAQPVLRTLKNNQESNAPPKRPAIDPIDTVPTTHKRQKISSAEGEGGWRTSSPPYDGVPRMTCADVLYVDSEHHVLICKLCTSGVVPGKGVETHFRTHQIRGAVLREVIEHTSRFVFANPLVCPLPADGRPPIPELMIQRGYRCTQCSCRARARDTIIRHWRLAGHEANGIQYEEVGLRSWCKGRHTRYWIVRDS